MAATTLISNRDQTYSGQVFIANRVTAVAIPILSSTAPIFAVWNPAGSGVNCIPMRLTAGYVSGTEAPGNVQLAATINAGSAVAAGGPITAFTPGVLNTDFFNAKVNQGSSPLTKFGTAATLAAGATLLQALGFSHLTTTAASTTVPGYQMIYDFNDLLMIPPGTFVHVVASAATVTTYNLSMVWREEPV